ncbi:hypothetical protein AMATHDRAFT_136380 [Amanita thiersii Skay4041]|uniref:Uncharacterized protein n=1 Tax=Amanita thiersii Skay4041 TaxID=703135 RepID=A0A2A9NSS3_9AGAR|nr:hypothetical protein AMATHDRAFT_136380 [Amanita thiersii Skay4041]
MKFVLGASIACALAAFVSSRPVKRDVDPALVPEFGVQPGLNPTGTGDCDGITNPLGQVVKIPCSCPPDRATFVRSLNANVDAGHATNNPSVPVSFPIDNSKASKLTRIQAALVTLQNLNGPGVGCPAASTTFLAQQKAIQDSPDVDAASSPATPSSTPSNSPKLVDPALVPDLGVQRGVNPTGSGDCDGITNPQGQVVKIPCSCPPDRDTFIKALSENVAQGRAINNPSVSVTFPTDDSNASKAARIQASLITLQNLNGPGVGCPAASTTLLVRQFN